jgi:hypothetical protein
MVMVMVMVMVTATTVDTTHIAMLWRLDGIMDARSAGAAEGARPVSGNRAAADAIRNPCEAPSLTGRRLLQKPSRSRTRPAITAVVTPTDQNACIGIGLIPVTGMSISARSYGERAG